MRLFSMCFILLLARLEALPCTIFVASNSRQTLVGNNEDYTPDIRTWLWVRPRAESHNGYVFWGFEEKYPEGGVNDKGLFYDAAALPGNAPFVHDSTKKDFNGYIVEKVLQECSTVEDVIRWVSKYNLNWYRRAQVMVADRTGDYAIINAGYIIHGKERKFVLTNYNLNDPANAGFRCWRRNTAYQLLDTARLSVGLFARILDEAAQRQTDNATVYSQVCDLKSNTVYLYQRHDFSVVKELNLTQLLKKGRQDLEMKDLFPVTDMERELEKFGYQLIDSNRVADAIRLFLVNCQHYPGSDKAIAALADAYLVAGKQSEADSLYKKAAAINPDNSSVRLFRRQDSVTFRIKGMPGAATIALAGTFNNYDVKANLFVRVGDEWICTIKLPPGDYSYKFNIDGFYWIQDPSNPLHHKPKEWWDSYIRVPAS